MKIAILSDTHNHRANLGKAIEIIQTQQIETIFHCGDLILPDLFTLFNGYRLIFTFGNNDTQLQAIWGELMNAETGNTCAYVYHGEIEGVPIAATHGHIPGKVDELAESGQYRYVFHGHSHRRKDQTVGSTRIINPGALGGLKPQERSFCILDLETDQAEFVLL
jgi:putative phosphoesterase